MLIVDTSVLIGHLRGDAECLGLLRRELKRGDVRVPTLVEWELWKGAPTPREQAVVRALLDMFEPALLTPRVAQVAGRLHHERMGDGRPLASIDLLIAAHALAQDCPLATLDEAFRRIPELEIMVD